MSMNRASHGHSLWLHWELYSRGISLLNDHLESLSTFKSSFVSKKQSVAILDLQKLIRLVVVNLDDQVVLFSLDCLAELGLVHASISHVGHDHISNLFGVRAIKDSLVTFLSHERAELGSFLNKLKDVESFLQGLALLKSKLQVFLELLVVSFLKLDDHDHDLDGNLLSLFEILNIL